jgi:hypothetical protein
LRQISVFIDILIFLEILLVFSSLKDKKEVIRQYISALSRTRKKSYGSIFEPCVAL